MTRAYLTLGCLGFAASAVAQNGIPPTEADIALHKKMLAKRDLLAVAWDPRHFYGQSVKVCGVLHKENDGYWLVKGGRSFWPDGEYYGLRAKHCRHKKLEVDQNGWVEGLVRRIDQQRPEDVKNKTRVNWGSPDYVVTQGCSLREELPK